MQVQLQSEATVRMPWLWTFGERGGDRKGALPSVTQMSHSFRFLSQKQAVYIEGRAEVLRIAR